MKKNMKKLAVGFGVFVMAVGSLMGCSSLGSGGNEQGEILKELPEGFDKETVRKQAMEDIEIAQSKDYESWKQVYQGSAEQSDRRIVRFLFENPRETGRIQRVWKMYVFRADKR